MSITKEDNKIIMSAIKIRTGLIITGRRHHNCFELMQNMGIPQNYVGDSIQGFITFCGKFLNRQQAAKVAYKNGQISKLKNTLYSEDLW